MCSAINLVLILAIILAIEVRIGGGRYQDTYTAACRAAKKQSLYYGMARWWLFWILKADR